MAHRTNGLYLKYALFATATFHIRGLTCASLVLSLPLGAEAQQGYMRIDFIQSGHRALTIVLAAAVAAGLPRPATSAGVFQKDMPDGASVTVARAMITLTRPDGSCYVSSMDATEGVRVSTSAGYVSGTVISFSGVLASDADTGERYISASPDSFHEEGPPSSIPKPVHISVSAAGGAAAGLQPGVSGGAGANSIGAFVSVTGRLQSVDSQGRYFQVRDASGNELRVVADGRSLQADQLVEVTGVLSLYTSGINGLLPQVLTAGGPAVRPLLADLGEGASLNGLRPFPADNPWNQAVDTAPVDPNSAAIIASIGLDTGLHADFGANWNGGPFGIPYIVVGGGQARAPVSFRWWDESDPGPYPIPPDAPIEGGPDSSGDRHIIVVDRDNWKLYEMYAARPADDGWTADAGAVFDLNSNALRPSGWTSADAAGLPIFPGLVRYDEVQSGEIRHALRFTVWRSRRAYVPPATHWASSYTNPSYPPMGCRVRLKAGFDITPYPAPVQVILKALKKYGMFVADNGSDWFISGAPDARWVDEEMSEISAVKGSNFEVVEMQGLVTP